MTPDETRAFAQRLMEEVWFRFVPEAVERFYQPDFVGHHRGQTIGRQDIFLRLKWDQQNYGDPQYDIRQIVADRDAFAIRFGFACTMIKTGERYIAEVMYFYRLRDAKIAEFWLLSDTPFEYKQVPDS